MKFVKIRFRKISIAIQQMQILEDNEGRKLLK